METQVFIDALSQALGQQVEKDGDGAYAFMLDGVPVLLHYRPSDSSFLLHMEIGYPTGLGGRIHARLLGANFLLSETHGAAISLDERTGLAFLELAFGVDALDGAGFVARIEGFVALADEWTRRLREWNDEIESQVGGRIETFLRELESGTEDDQADEVKAAETTMIRV
ncbi:Tir chaperone protein (CesT) family protein [Desulfomicrobium apsheronum]|uniref:Tir chaperone protein (CesT) family protein n=1 Tax=Desulfomicrobium apsheronum TaxID=52560 RepID=A0A1I3PPK9_9BACT|nr:type III secretion system chaperone [Desulfomicrobium apsheronum]SFJ23270.1 Tir chaperone protein (CesT) family protein [Desulfomicrobium apsheronum]